MKINYKCVGCGQCIAFCKYEAITVNGIATITDACVKCKICMAYCPLKAIEVDK